MINGVMHIVAAVLFAVISVHEGMNLIWIGIAGVYLLTGIINLVAHALRIRKIEKAAKKAEQEKQTWLQVRQDINEEFPYVRQEYFPLYLQNFPESPFFPSYSE